MNLSENTAAGSPLPNTVGDYVIDSFIGGGAYGKVYRAHDKLNKNFALKILCNSISGASERELRGLTDLRNTIRAEDALPIIYHVGQTPEGKFYYTMDLADNASGIPGTYEPDTLENRLRKQERLSADECITLIRQLLVSVATLHRHDLVHRDIKPGNVIYLNGKPVLADLGLVTSAPCSLVGTAGFLPPCPPGGPTLESEKAADLYSLGKVLYCAFTGEPAERYPLLPQNFSLKEFSRIRPLYQKACAETPEQRFHSCREFADMLERVAAQTATKANTKIAVCLLSLLCIAGVMAFWAYWVNHKPVPAASFAAAETACVKMTLDNGVYQILCCFSSHNLKDPNPHARGNQFMAAGFVKSALARELKIPKNRKLKIRYGKYRVQPFREGELLVYIYEIAAADCLSVPKNDKEM